MPPEELLLAKLHKNQSFKKMRQMEKNLLKTLLLEGPQGWDEALQRHGVGVNYGSNVENQVNVKLIEKIFARRDKLMQNPEFAQLIRDAQAIRRAQEKMGEQK